MKKNKAFSLAEVMITMAVIAVMAMLSIPTLVIDKAEKKNLAGYQRAFKTVSDVTGIYLGIPFSYISSTPRNAAMYAKFFIESAGIKALYVNDNLDETYSALKFRGGITAGAKNPITTSPEIKISETPQFWFVTDDNIAYSIIIPDRAMCSEVLNINTASNLKDTLKASCFAVVVDVNGLFSQPNRIDDIQDCATLEKDQGMIDDRYYIFIGSDGVAAGNPKHILSAKLYSGKN